MNTNTIGEKPPNEPATSRPLTREDIVPSRDDSKIVPGVIVPPKAPGPPAKKSRMTLDNTRDGLISSPMRILIYGGEKIGKSTFAAGAPGALWLGADGGTDHLDIRRLPQPESFDEVLEALNEVATRGYARGVRTLVIDPLNWFEPLIVADVVGVSGKTLNSWDGGYGRGNDAAMDRWRLIKKGLERVCDAGINVILCAHAHAKKFEDPEGPGFERWELAMSKQPAGLFKQWVDAILFARPDTFGRVDPTTKKIKAAGSDARILHTELAPAFDAGNRWRLPKELPLSWPAFIEAKTKGEEETRTLRAQIDRDLLVLADPAIESRVRMWLADPKVDLAEVANVVARKRAETEEHGNG